MALLQVAGTIEPESLTETSLILLCYCTHYRYGITGGYDMSDKPLWSKSSEYSSSLPQHRLYLSSLS